MSVFEVEAILLNEQTGLKKWTSARTVRKHDPSKPFPAAIDPIDEPLPAIIWTWGRRRGPRRYQGNFEKNGNGSLVPNRIDPAYVHSGHTHPYDITDYYFDQHQPQLRLLLVAKPYMLPRMLTIDVEDVTGTFDADLAPGTGEGEVVMGPGNFFGWLAEDKTGEDPAQLVLYGLNVPLYTEDGNLITFVPGDELTGQTSGATATVTSVTASFESLDDLEFEVANFFGLHAKRELEGIRVKFEDIMPVPDLGGTLSTSQDLFEASMYDIRLDSIEEFGMVKRTIEHVPITMRMRDVDGSTVITQEEQWNAVYE